MPTALPKPATSLHPPTLSSLPASETAVAGVLQQHGQLEQKRLQTGVCPLKHEWAANSGGGGARGRPHLELPATAVDETSHCSSSRPCSARACTPIPACRAAARRIRPASLAGDPAEPIVLSQSMQWTMDKAAVDYREKEATCSPQTQCRAIGATNADQCNGCGSLTN